MGRKEKNTFPSIDEIKNEIYEFIDSVGADERFKSKLFKFLQGLENRKKRLSWLNYYNVM